MDYRSRDRDHRHREDILLETNFDEDGALTTVHMPNNQNFKSPNGQYTSAGGPLQRNNGRRSFYRSDTSIDRYSEYSLHGRREKGISSIHITHTHTHVYNHKIICIGGPRAVDCGSSGSPIYVIVSD